MQQYKTRTIGQGQEYRVYDYAQDPLGQLGETPDGRVFRYVKIVGNTEAGNVLSEDITQNSLKSAKVRTGQLSQYLEVVFGDVAANTRLFDKDELQFFRDDTSLGGRLYRVQTNPEVMNDDDANAADVTVPITVVDLTAPDGATIPSDYSQGTANKAVVYATNYREAQVIDLSTAVTAGKSRRIVGVAQVKIAATADKPKYAWVQVGGPALVTKTTADACDAGRPLVASPTANKGGEVQNIDDATDVVRYPIGTVRYAATAADTHVLADLNIQS